MNKLAVILVAGLGLVGCGDDEGAAGGPGGGPPPPPPPPAAAKPVGSKLQPRQHIEDKIDCPVPDAPTKHPACTPLDAAAGAALPQHILPDCEAGTYCMNVQNTFTCEPCAERESIRHDFKDRDFVEDQSRDPFDQSGVISQAGLGKVSTTKPEPHQSCKRAEQFRATNYSYQDLRLVGIVAQGTNKRVLMMDSANLGWIIHRGDCVGKEKAVVKDIGTGYVTFVVDEDPDTKRPATETSVQLHPGGLEMDLPTSQPSPANAAPASMPAAPSSAPATPATPASPAIVSPESTGPAKR
jgi:Tfp pilus assembly protein PilP